MTNRKNNYNKTFIDYCYDNDLTTRYIIVFDKGQPHDKDKNYLSRDIAEFDWTTYENNRMNYCALISIYLMSGTFARLICPDNIARQDALEIARHYRPTVGRSLSAIWASIILAFHDNEKFKKIVKFLMYIHEEKNNYKKDRDDLILKIKSVIKDCVKSRNKYRQNRLPTLQCPRFIVIPYYVLFKNGAHFVTLIVDLDHMEGDKYVPFVYVYDSSHFLCYAHGINSYKLNKNDYFNFSNDILVDDEPLNNDINWSPHLFAINDEKTSKLQYICKMSRPVELRCGYYCEAAVNLLLSNEKFIDYDNNISSGQETREFLREILKNKYVLEKIEKEIIPPRPFELFNL